MTTVGEILKDKSGAVHTINAEAMVLDAVRDSA